MSGKAFHSRANEGIQGHVRADVLAVGRNARASKTVTVSSADHAELQTAIQELREAIASIPVSARARQMLTSDARELEQVLQSEAPDKEKVGGLLEKISGKLKMVGEISHSFAQVVSPLLKIAGVLHLPTAVCGLL